MHIVLPFKSETTNSIMTLNKEAKSGFYPIGSNNFWHGGLHFSTDKAVQSVAEGNLIAYRIDDEPKKHPDGSPYSTGFVLTKHKYITPKNQDITFYCLYMHLLPVKSYTENQIKDAPDFLRKCKFCVHQAVTLRAEPSQSGKALCILQVGTDLSFEGDPKEHTNTYTKVKHGNYKGKTIDGKKDIEVTLSEKSPGYVFFSSKYLSAVFYLDMDKCNIIIEPEKEVKFKPGDLLGFPGPYIDKKNIIHFEIFVESIDFLENKKGDKGVSKTLIIDPGADLRSFDNNADSVEKNEKLKLTVPEAEAKNYNLYRPVETKDGKKGYALKTDLDYVPKEKSYTTKKPIVLLHSIPNSKVVPAVIFSKSAGKNTDRLIVETNTTEKFIDDTKKVWRKFSFDKSTKEGWINEDDPKVKVVTSYDWPGWEKIEENGKAKFSDDGFCDVESLLALLDTDKNKNISVEEMYSATMDNYLGPKIRRLACCHPTEWDAESEGNTKWERLKKPPWKLDEKAYKSAIDFIRTLQWWGEIKKTKLPSPKEIWHVNPIGFLQNLIRLDVPLTVEARDKIIDIVSKHEGEYDSCNDDKEFKGIIETDYSSVVHIGLSWGFIQFTQDGGSLGEVLKRMNDNEKGGDPKKFQEIFGTNWEALIELTNAKGKGGTALLGEAKANKNELDVKAKKATEESENVEKEAKEAEENAKKLKKKSDETSKVEAEKAKKEAKEAEEKAKMLQEKAKSAKMKADTANKETKDAEFGEIRSVRVQKLEVEKSKKDIKIVEVDKNKKAASIKPEPEPQKQDLWEGEWLKRFKKAGKEEVFQKVQREIAIEKYLTPALKLCKRMNLRSEKAIAIAFDRFVQEGSGAISRFQFASGGESIEPMSELEYLDKLSKTIYKSGNKLEPDIIHRMTDILNNNDLSITNYNVDTY
ncbi:MAG TPA: hypothetical protein VI362_03435 [Ignavibacteriaceae bacterium]|nr:hypothetical protein [Ignavibacteriaceae bacterium]